MGGISKQRENAPYVKLPNKRSAKNLYHLDINNSMFENVGLNVLQYFMAEFVDS